VRISTKIRYGTRAILELAIRFGSGPVDLREIANKQDISVKYLEQVFIPLRTAGLVKSVRGSKGGYVLAKPPAEIALKDVVEAFEGPIRLIECLNDPALCEQSRACVTRDIWGEISQAIESVFGRITFEEMVKRRKEKELQTLPMYQI